jgi:hypothetical protein
VVVKVMEVILHLEAVDLSDLVYDLLLRDAPLGCQSHTSMPEAPTGSSCLSKVGRWRYRASDSRYRYWSILLWRPL